MLNLDLSRKFQSRAERVMPGGVNSPVRAFRAVGGDPPFMMRGRGSRLWDVDGNEYIDYVCSWGPLLLGHAHAEVVAAVTEAAQRGTSFGASTLAEIELAEIIREAFPSIEKLRLVNSGTEATMSAIRLARAFTGREYVIKFEGCYHGHADALLVKAGSGVATFGIPGSAGVPEELVRFTLALPYNNIAAVEQAFGNLGSQIACVIVEPVAGNMGCVPPVPGYLDSLRHITAGEGALLIFDEVITGFRLGFGGAQEMFGVRPDLTTLGKIIGGGLPVGAYGGRAEIMDMVAPLGPVYQAGTLSGNPLAVAAGLSTLSFLRQHPETYSNLEQLAIELVHGVAGAAQQAGVGVVANRVGSMFTWFFADQAVTDWQTASKSNTALFGRFHRAMLERGIWLPPSQFESAFVSTEHSEEDVARTITAAQTVFGSICPVY
jgi:glutamate-1-semialdehyde 2,1-aminomutase